MTDCVVSRRLKVAFIGFIICVVCVAVVWIEGISTGLTTLLGIGLILPSAAVVKFLAAFVTAVHSLEDRSFSNIFRLFSYLLRRFKVSLLCFLGCTLVLAILQVVFFDEDTLPSHVVYLIGVAFATLSFWKTDHVDEDLGPGLVCAYATYRNYFKHSLPGMHKKVLEYEQRWGICIPVKKLILMFPASCYVPDTFGSKEDDDLRVRVHGCLEEIYVSINGTKHRMMHSTVYEVSHESGTFYCVAEGVAAMLALFELEKRKILTAEGKRRQLSVFFRTLKELLENDSNCKYNCILAPYDDSVKKVSTVWKQVVNREMLKLNRSYKDEGLLLHV